MIKKGIYKVDSKLLLNSILIFSQDIFNFLIAFLSFFISSLE